MHDKNKLFEQSPSAEANNHLAGPGFLYFLLIRSRQGRRLSLVNTDHTYIYLYIYLYISISIYIYYLSIFAYVLQFLVTYSFVYRAELKSC